MVFLTCIVIVSIFYYLQTDGLVYIIIIAVVAELMNIFMTQTLAKSIEKKAAAHFGKLINSHKAKIAEQQKTIKALEEIQEKSISKIYKANLKIKEYEEKLGIKEEEGFVKSKEILPPQIPSPAKEDLPQQTGPKEFIDLPSGSNRKKLPF
jgi:hypothetical protein